jgi:TonB family protein
MPQRKNSLATVATDERLLNMESSAIPDYENLEGKVLHRETETGAVKHNESTGWETEENPPRRPQAPVPAATMAKDLQMMDSDSEATAALNGGDELLDAFLGKAFEEKPIWVQLGENVRDLFFPKKLPPLELTSKPIPVPDRMAVKTNPWAVGISSAINIAILLILLFFVGKKIIETVNKPTLKATNVDVSTYNPLKAPKAATTAGGGGGGGDHSLVDPTKGHLPKIEKNPMVPPMIPVLDKPKLAIESAIDVQKEIKLPDNPNMPMIGVKNSANVKLASNGQGGGGGMGTGYGGGLGSGRGNGYGPGSGGNTGGGLYRVGGSVSAPVALNSVEAEFSDEARRAKYQGVCLISLIVDAQGNPQNPRVIRALGMGLDEKALEAVRKYRFRPAMKDGRTPVPVMITVEVNFRLY